MIILPKLIFRLSKIPIKIPTYFILEIDKQILKFAQKGKEPGTHETILESKVKGLHQLISKFTV
jgi:hypothetical protein